MHSASELTVNFPARPRGLGLALCLGVLWLGGTLSIPIFCQQTIVLAGSGSTLATPILNVWSQAFNRDHHGVRVGYIATNSGEGIRQIRLQMGDFAIGEIPLTRQQLEGSSVRLTELPIAVANVVPVYNVPGVRRLRFTPELLAQIYMGKVTNWNDSRISACNRDVALPGIPIVVIDRREGGGTRYLWSEFLSHSSGEYRAWAAMTTHARTETMVSSSVDMAQRVGRVLGAFGYTEMSLAIRHNLAMGAVRNRAGKFVEPSEATIRAAVKAKEGVASRDFRTFLMDAEGDNSYPIISFSWVFAPLSGVSLERRSALRDFLIWSLKDGQLLAPGNGYSPLPEAVAARARAELESEVQ